jgi:hypothetical protein
MRSRIVADARASIIGAVHLVVPFAAASSEAARSALASLTTPALDALLAQCEEVARDDGDETALDMPHERALARAFGWRAAPEASDAPLPWAARAARADGVDVGTSAWALLTPTHWRVGADAVHLADPRALMLDESASRALFEAVRPLFESEGLLLAWGAALRWYASHAAFATLRTASLERVIGRNVDRWLPRQPEAKLVRRLQNEVQMLLHTHPINEAREAVGALPVNSFWLSGCGVYQPAVAPNVQVDERLSAPALAEDGPAWSAAWRALDASLLPTRPLLRITLCGERSAVTFERAERRWWQRAAASLRTRRPSRDWLATL